MKQRSLVTLLIIETVILAFVEAVLLGKGTCGYENTQNAGTIVQIFHGTFQDKQKFLEKNHQMANTL